MWVRWGQGSSFQGENGTPVPLLTVAAVGTHALHDPASADRLHFQSFLDH